MSFWFELRFLLSFDLRFFLEVAFFSDGILSFFCERLRFYWIWLEIFLIFFWWIPVLLAKLWKQSCLCFLIEFYFHPLKLIYKHSGGHFELLWRPFWIFVCRIFIFLQSCGNKVVFVFWSESLFSPKNHF